MFVVAIKYNAFRFNTLLVAAMFLTGFTAALITEPAFYLRGNIVIGGVSETLDLACEIADEFRKHFPFVNATVQVLDHAEVHQAVLSRKVNIAVVSEFCVSEDKQVEYVCSGKRGFLLGTPFLSPVKELDCQSIREILENRITTWSHLGYDYGEISVVSFLNASSSDLVVRILGLSEKELEFLRKNTQDMTSYLRRGTEYSGEHATDFYIISSDKLTAQIHPIALKTDACDEVFELFDEYLLQAHIYCVLEAKTPHGFRGWYRRLFQNAYLSFTERYLTDLLASRKDTTELCAIGDVMLDRGVKEVILEFGPQHLFSSTRRILLAADIVFCNLEGPITSEGRRLNMFRANPDAVHVLRDGSIDIVSLANNHILDFDDLGLMRTLDNLSRAAIKYVGAGANIGEARREVVFEIKSTRIAFLAYTETWFMWTNIGRKWEADDTAPGVALACEEYMIEDIARAKRDSDMVIVSVHWGKEYVDIPTETQYRLARTAIDAGASIVLGHHPHVLQGIEFYNDGIICYSLGNFIFDLKRLSTKETGIFKFLIWNGRVIGLEFIPCYAEDCMPVPVSGGLQDRIWGRLKQKSLLIDTGKKR
jgi:poly-gamma-glutamate capsule biosynthesis protein CapA/YwtB (metallophosphatase superfamily)